MRIVRLMLIRRVVKALARCFELTIDLVLVGAGLNVCYYDQIARAVIRRNRDERLLFLGREAVAITRDVTLLTVKT